jgi:type II secretory pathway pseudopilin PulG
VTRWMRPRHRLTADDGLGLIEVMLSIFILGVALAALASVGLTSLTSTRVSRDREQATNAASAAIEVARARDFAALAMTPGSVNVASIPPDAVPAGSTATCFDGEPVVTDAVADPITFQEVVGNGDRVTIHTLVTYADGTCAAASLPAAPTDLKRVIAIASWTDNGVVRTVRQETLVAAAGRGLPVPEFQVKPPDAALGISQAFLKDSAITNRNRCVEHQLRNLGSEDSYEWELLNVSKGTITPFKNGYRGGDWLVTAYLEFPSLTTSRSGVPPATITDLMLPASEAGRPYSDARVTTGNVATVTVCYEPAAGTVDAVNGVWPADLVAQVAIHSRFDDRRFEVVEHRISTIDESAPGTPFRLFDPNDSVAHPRQLAPYVMGVQAPPGADPSLVSNLGTIDYRDASKSNWSTDVGTHPGVRFRRALASESREVGPATMAWHHQFLGPTVLLPDATLLLWHAPTSALGGTLPLSGEPVRLEIRVDVLRKNEKTVEWAGVATPYEYTHTAVATATTTGWSKLEIPLNLGGQIAVKTDQYLRLRVTCAPTNASDCNVAYDNVAHPSALFVKVKL